MNVSVEINGKSCHTALADACVQIRIQVGKLALERADIHIICFMPGENLVNLLLDFTVRRTL